MVEALILHANGEIGIRIRMTEGMEVSSDRHDAMGIGTSHSAIQFHLILNILNHCTNPKPFP
jgi:hypothetical protein